MQNPKDIEAIRQELLNKKPLADKAPALTIKTKIKPITSADRKMIQERARIPSDRKHYPIIKP